MLQGFAFSVEGFNDKESSRLSKQVLRNGGEFSSVFTSKTTHLLVNSTQKEGFQEKAIRRGNKAWVVNGTFVDASVKAGMILPEYQFAITRGDQLSSVVSSFDRDNDTNSIIPELLERLNSEGGQLWSICGSFFDPISSTVSTLLPPRYLLGGVEKTSSKNNNNNNNNNNQMSNNNVNTSKSNRNISEVKGSLPMINSKKYKSKKIDKKKENNKKSNCKSNHLIKPKNKSINTAKKSTTPSHIHSIAQSQIIEGQSNNQSENQSENQLDNQSEKNMINEEDLGSFRSDEELFIDFDGGINHTVMISSTGEVWVKQFLSLPKKIQFDFGNKVCAVSCGKNHSLLLTVSGEVFGWGEGYLGQLGNNAKGNVKTPIKITHSIGNIPIISISAFSNSSAVLSKTGGIFTWGDNKQGQLGLGHTHLILIPTLVSFTHGREVVEIECGGSHMFAVTREGELLSWGSNRYGQLGRKGNGTISSLPGFVEGLPINDQTYITQISCGMFHSAVVLSNREIYTWGLGGNGRLGTVESKAVDTPSLLTSFPASVDQVSCGDYHTCFIVENRVYISGEMKYGTQGHAEQTVTYHTPEVVNNLYGCKDVKATYGKILLLVTGYQNLLKLHVIEGNVTAASYIINGLSASRIHYSTYINEEINANQDRLLHSACLYDQSEVVEFLLSRCPQIDVNIQNSQKETPLHAAVKGKSSKSIKALLSFPDIQIDVLDNKSNTPLMLAVKEKANHCLEVLIMAGANKVMKDEANYTPLHVAIINKSWKSAILLIRNAASITERDQFKRTPLDYCSPEYISGLRKMAETNECFISYAHKDIEFAYALRCELNRHCLRCWMDDWRLQAGGDWRSAIGNGLNEASVVVFIASEASVVSDWCLKELYLAVSSNKTIIIVEQEKFEDQEPYLDILIREQVLINRSKGFDFSTTKINTNEFQTLTQKLAKKLHNLLVHRTNQNNSSLSARKTKLENLSKPFLIESKLPFVILGLTNEEVNFGQYLSRELNQSAIPSSTLLLSSDISTNEQIEEEEFISKCWIYFLIVNENLMSPRVLKHLSVIERYNKQLILLFHDHDNRKEMWPHLESLFRVDQLEKFNDLFSFYLSDSQAVQQILHTLNLLQKSRLLDERIAVLAHKLDQKDKENLYIKDENDFLLFPDRISVAS